MDEPVLLENKNAVLYGVGGETAAFLASDRASAITRTTVNLSSGSILD